AEMRGRGELSRKPPLLAAIPMRRHRTAVRQQKIFDPNGPSAGQFGNEAFRHAGLAVEILDADVEDTALTPQLSQFRPGHVAGNIRTLQAIDLEIAIVAEYDSLLRIGDHHTLVEVVQGRTDECISAESGTLTLARRRDIP